MLSGYMKLKCGNRYVYFDKDYKQNNINLLKGGKREPVLTFIPAGPHEIYPTPTPPPTPISCVDRLLEESLDSLYVDRFLDKPLRPNNKRDKIEPKPKQQPQKKILKRKLKPNGEQTKKTAKPEAKRRKVSTTPQTQNSSYSGSLDTYLSPVKPAIKKQVYPVFDKKYIAGVTPTKIPSKTIETEDGKKSSFTAWIEEMEELSITSLLRKLRRVKRKDPSRYCDYDPESCYF